MIENINERLIRVHEIDEEISRLKREKDSITAKFQAYGLQELENKNIKYLELSSSEGSCNIGYKEKLTVDNFEKLRQVAGSIVDAKAKITMEPKIEFVDKKFQTALIALYKQEYKEHDLTKMLRELGMDDSQIKTALKKLKGEYFKDKALLESFGVNDESLEEELDMVREHRNYELVTRYFDPDTIDLEELRKAIFVEDSLTVGYKFKE